MQFVDTNLFVRFLAQDDPEKSEASRRWFDDVATGRVDATTSELVIGEVIYVLTSRNLYAFEREDLAPRLAVLLALPNLQIDNRASLLRALNIYVERRKLDFTDALTIAHMERLGIDLLVSYDRDFDRVPGITRLEP